MDSKNFFRFVRAVLAGDFEAPSRRTSSGVALFLAGVGAGVLIGMLFAPLSGEQLRSEIGDRARESFEKAKSKTEEFSARSKVSGSEKSTSEAAEKSAS
jgi:gas vesicle protein